MAFGQTSILDNFNRADEGPPMTGWATPALAAGLKIVTNVCAANAANALGVWNSILSSADCESWFTVSTATALSGIVYVFGRLKEIASAATLDGYSVSVTEAATDTWAINSVTNGVATAIGATFNQEVSNGDAIGICCVGSSIQAWYKASGGSWSMLAERTDGTYAAAGYIGAGITDTTGRIDDFGGGNFIPSISRSFMRPTGIIY